MITMNIVRELLSIFNNFERSHLKSIGDFAKTGQDYLLDSKAKDVYSILKKELKKELDQFFGGTIDEELEDYIATHIFGVVTGAIVAASTYAYMI